MTKEVFLHVGHGKTGSSYIQSFLANNVDELARCGIHYPHSPSVELAKQGKISTGNFPADGIMEHFERIAESSPDHTSKILFSNETIFERIMSGSPLLEYFSERGNRVNILLFTRDPLEFIRSSYIQSVKRGGYTKDIDSYVLERGCTLPLLPRVGTFIDLCKAHSVNLTLRNYDRHKSNLIAPVAAFLGIDPAGFNPVEGIVNRSLADGEILLQRAFKKHFGAGSARFVSDALCNEAPSIPASRILPGKKLLDTFITNVNAEMRALNDRFDDAFDRYEIIDPATIDGSEGEAPISFTEEQLDVVARSISRQITDSRRIMNFGRKALLERARFIKTSFGYRALLRFLGSEVLSRLRKG